MDGSIRVSISYLLRLDLNRRAGCLGGLRPVPAYGPRSHDVTRADVRARILSDLRTGYASVLVATPCTSFSVARGWALGPFYHPPTVPIRALPRESTEAATCSPSEARE